MFSHASKEYEVHSEYAVMMSRKADIVVFVRDKKIVYVIEVKQDAIEYGNDNKRNKTEEINEKKQEFVTSDEAKETKNKQKKSGNHGKRNGKRHEVYIKLEGLALEALDQIQEKGYSGEFLRNYQDWTTLEMGLACNTVVSPSGELKVKISVQKALFRQSAVERVLVY